MNENQTLEMQIKANAQQAVSSLDRVLKELGLVQNSVSKVTTTVNKNGDTTLKNLTSIEKQGNKVYKVFQKIDKDGKLKTVSTTMSNLKENTDKTASSAKKLNTALSLGGAYFGFKRLTTTFLGWMDLAVDRTEQMNLFNVVFKNIEKDGVKTFSELGKSATQFQYKLNETFGSNMTETMKYQGLFQSMGENVGIGDSYSAIMSETMTKLTYDLASLYNKSESTVAEALRAGVYAGQTKPLRSYGIDVTQTSMQPILDKLGITDRSVKQMSQAEKEILRYIATLEQAQVAMGDFANTIESPSNQAKIFGQQLTEAKVALTSLFIGTYSKILPYANALLMVVTQVSKAIADMFGIELTDYNSGIASSEDAYIDLEESIEGATDAVKELKRQTLGFDQINNISENKDNTSNLSGGIDQRLLDAIKGYENGMGKVRMEATKIRDRIMEWLGFTKDIDAITEEVSFKFTDTDSLLYKIVNSLKDIVTNGKEAISKVFNIIKEDFDNGIFGYLLLGVFESISNILGLIADNEYVATIIARILETLILIKGLQMIPGVKTLGGIITNNLIGTAGATNGLGATGLLGTFTLLTAIAGVWTIELIYKTVDAATQALKTNANTINEVVTGAMDARRKFFDLAKAGDTTSESFNELTEYMLDNIKRSQELAKSISLTKEQQNLLNQTNNNTLEIIKKLADEGLITEDIYWKFAEAIKGADAAVLNLNPNLEDGKNKTFYFEEECRKAKDSVDTLTGNISNYKDELGLLNDKTSTSKTNLDGLKDGLKNLGDSAHNSKDKVKELNDNLGLTKSKQITIDIDANTNKFSNKLTNAIAGAFGALGAIGTRANGGIYTNGNWHNIPQYANGGAPSHGTMFVAGEAGAEIVGHINGRTEVLNQSQIASAIYSAVFAAMSQANSSANKVDVDVRVHSDGSVVIDEINQTTKQTGVCPIYIPAT